ncbi:MAG: nuclease-related domain-containing protein [Erysipelotrichaceae bacterium]
MAKMYPENLPIGIEIYLLGESKVFEALKSQLDNTWTVYHNVSWHQSSNNQSRQRDGEIDFIIAHPDYGFLVLEVKGGFQIVYHPEKDNWVSINDGMESFDIKNPYFQARDNKYAFLKNLGTIKDLSKYSSEILEEAINVGYCVAFPDVSRVSSGLLPIYASQEITLFTHDIENNLNRKLLKIFDNYSRGKSTNMTLISHANALLREILAPQFVLDRSLK